LPEAAPLIGRAANQKMKFNVDGAADVYIGSKPPDGKMPTGSKLFPSGGHLSQE